MKRLLSAIPLGWLLALPTSPALAEDVDEGRELSFAPYRWTLALGYRAIGVDRPKGSAAFDGTLHGPILGAVFRWGAGRQPSGAAQSQP